MWRRSPTSRSASFFARRDSRNRWSTRLSNVSERKRKSSRYRPHQSLLPRPLLLLPRHPPSLKIRMISDTQMTSQSKPKLKSTNTSKSRVNPWSILNYPNYGLLFFDGGNDYNFYSMSKRVSGPSSHETELYDRITKLQTRIIDKVTQLRKERPHCDCKHFEGLRPPCEPYDPAADYYQKYWKCFLLNQLCYARLKDSHGQLGLLEERTHEVEEMFQLHDELTEGKGAKRLRRQAHQLIKEYSCPYTRCFKSYGAEIALNLHIKLKHNGGTKTERERAAEAVIRAKERGLPIPTVYINFPPGYLEDYARRRQGEKESKGQNIYEEEE